MFRLETFGTLTLEGKAAPVPNSATQRRQLALLAIVANAGPAGIPRDKAAVLLWPETDNARHSLSQLLYSIRHALGTDPVISRAGNLRLDPEVMSSGVTEFDAALESGDIPKASELYKGPFLDGFNPPSSAEYERWTDSERARRAGQLTAAIEKLAKRFRDEEDFAAAAEWWKRLALLDPFNSRVAVSLMRALDLAGNRPGALQHARAHAELVRSEIGVEPDPVVTGFANELQTNAGRVYTPSFTPPYEVEDSVSPTAPHAGKDVQSTVSERGKLRYLLFGGAAIATAAALFIAIGTNGAEQPSRPAGTTVAVLPFAVHSDSAITYLSEGLVDLLSRDLDGADDLRAVDPHAMLSYIGTGSPKVVDAKKGHDIASHFQAAYFVLGDVTEIGSRIRISANLFATGANAPPVAGGTVEGERSQLFELVDQLALKIVAGRYQGPRDHLVLTAATTTKSLPALKLYLAGEREFRSRNYPRAVQAFGKAVALDTTFALAYYRMSIAAEWEGRTDLQSSSATNALRFSNRLSDHDKQLVKALVARRARDPDLAESIYRQIVREFPDDVEAWYHLGEVLFHDNAMRGRSFLESREAWDHVLKLVPNDTDVLLHMIRVLSRNGTRASLDSAISRALPIVTPDQRLETEALRAFTLGTVHEQDSMVHLLASAKPGIVQSALWRIAVYARNLSGARRLAKILVEPRSAAPVRAGGHASMMLLLVAEGRHHEAYVEGAKTSRTYPWSPDVGLIHFQLLGFAHTDSAAARRLRDRFDAWKPPVISESELVSNPWGVMGEQFKAYSAGLLSIAVGETGRAREYARRLDNLKPVPAASGLSELFSVIVRASAARKDGDKASALSILENWKGGVPIELGGVSGAESYYGWLRAELLHEAGRDSEAVRWYDSRADLFVIELFYAAPADFRLGQIYERAGDRKGAAARYRKFIDLWKSSDPDLQPFVSHARARLKSLGYSSS